MPQPHPMDFTNALKLKLVEVADIQNSTQQAQKLLGVVQGIESVETTGDEAAWDSLQQAMVASKGLKFAPDLLAGARDNVVQFLTMQGDAIKTTSSVGDIELSPEEL